MQSTFVKRQFEFVVFVSYIVLLYFILWSTISVTKYVFFILSIDWMLEFFCHYLMQVELVIRQWLCPSI